MRVAGAGPSRRDEKGTHDGQGAWPTIEDRGRDAANSVDGYKSKWNVCLRPDKLVVVVVCINDPRWPEAV